MNNPLNKKAMQANDPQPTNDQLQTVKVVEEFATLSTEVVETGKVKITKTVTEETIAVNVPIINESYEVRHVTVPYKLLDEPPVSLIQQGDTTIITVVREISVVVKKYEVIEEIHVTKQVTETPLTHEISLRKEHVHVDRQKNS